MWNCLHTKIQMQPAICEANKGRTVDFCGDQMFFFLVDNPQHPEAYDLVIRPSFICTVTWTNRMCVCGQVNTWITKWRHSYTEISTVLCQHVVPLGQFFTTILWLLIILSMSSNKNFFCFSKECVTSLWDSATQQRQCWMCTVSILTTAGCLLQWFGYAWSWSPYSMPLFLMRVSERSSLQTHFSHNQIKWNKTFWQWWSASL
jgi:hypothetical protein